ncbi:MAG TPA: hypothetical protein PLL57_14130 [Flavobacteriales bacterium]|nr:hypothetical protein [Flavobacteriales bacterium]
MTFAPVALGDAPFDLDFTLASTATYGTEARKDINGTQVLWSGDVTFNGQVKYTGAGNDRDPILQAYRRRGAHGDPGGAVAVDAQTSPSCIATFTAAATESTCSFL